MSKLHFTREQVLEMQDNPHVYSVSTSKLFFTKEFKALLLEAYENGEDIKEVLKSYGFNQEVLGERRVNSLISNIKREYAKYGEIYEGNCRHKKGVRPCKQGDQADEQMSDKERIKRLQHEVEYLRQQVTFLKKISSIRNTQK